MSSKSVRELARERGTNGRGVVLPPGDSRAENRGSGGGTPTPRKTFPGEGYRVGQRVSIVRHEHGWVDGVVGGVIRSLSEAWCVVAGDDGCDYEIRHPRDIRPDR